MLKQLLCLLVICFCFYNILPNFNMIDITIYIISICTIITIILYQLKYYTNKIIYIIDTNGTIQEIKNICVKKN